MDVDRIRADFPILRRTVNGRPLVYLDSAATSQKPQCVLDAEDRFYAEHNSNVHRGVYALSVEATDAYEAARDRVRRFLRAKDADEVVFVRGTTEALNVAAASLGRLVLQRGDRVVTTVMEHHSNIVPWHLLREQKGIDLEFVDVDDAGRLRLDQLDRLLDRRTKVVAVTHASNVLGTVNPVREIADRAHAVGAVVVVDAAQSAPHRALDVGALGADLLAFSGHKVLGPMGIGVLWGRRELLARMPPTAGGGEMISEVHQDRVGYREPPGRFEAGTPNVAGAIGLAAALDYLEAAGWQDLAAHERRLFERAVAGLESRLGDRVRVYGPEASEERQGVLSFSMRGAHPHDVAQLLDGEGIEVRAGHHCCQPLMERLNVPALTRASPYLYNTETEIDRLVDGLVRVAGVFA
ncbi:MAG TPA: SufS family cysteine desulfurase [Thermoplasmata archaeon]|nr:SufS family cysteine desulfurase [Thermoplasmata archaeon]